VIRSGFLESRYERLLFFGFFGLAQQYDRALIPRISPLGVSKALENRHVRDGFRCSAPQTRLQCLDHFD
jgi:hypothetical protein